MIKKAIIPVAGLGTRLLPASKSIPKEMLTVVDRPAIHYVVQEAIDAGVTEIILVTRSNKECIADYFDSNFELEQSLLEKGKDDLLAEVRDILPPHVSVVSVRQNSPAGLGDAVLCAAPLVGNEPFIVMLPDMLTRTSATRSDLSEMVARHAKTGAPQVMVEQVPLADVKQYGIIAIKEEMSYVHRPSASITGFVEKPSPMKAPSNLAIVGRYILPPQIMKILGRTKPEFIGGEIQLTSALDELKNYQNIEAYLMSGRIYDCGSKVGYFKAVLDFASDHPIHGSEFDSIIQEKAESLG